MIESVHLEEVACPLGCTQDDEVVLTGHDRLLDLPGEFTIVKCRTCDLMRTNPRPTPETIGAYYPSDYGPYQSTNTPVTKSTSEIKQKVKRFLGLGVRWMPAIPVGRLLEIGCASGAYMEQMRREGWSVEGVEFSKTAAEQAHAKGFKVEVAAVESAQGPSEPVDVVGAWMVLEHLHEPIAALRKIRTWVKPDGYLIASIPDAGAFERYVFGERWYALHLPCHLFHYSPRTIAKILASAGWELEKITWPRNCNNLLWSMEYVARDKKYIRIEGLVRWVRTANKAAKFRLILGLLLGVMRQSGRMEIWARPIKDKVGQKV